MLSSEQKDQICGVLRLGGARGLALRLVGVSEEELARHMLFDADFIRQVTQAEASAELVHLRTIYDAAKDKGDWRAAVWWLEHRGASAATNGTSSDEEDVFKEFVAQLAELLAGEVASPEARRRLLGRLRLWAVDGSGTAAAGKAT